MPFLFTTYSTNNLDYCFPHFAGYSFLYIHMYMWYSCVQCLVLLGLLAGHIIDGFCCLWHSSAIILSRLLKPLSTTNITPFAGLCSACPPAPSVHFKAHIRNECYAAASSRSKVSRDARLKTF